MSLVNLIVASSNLVAIYFATISPVNINIIFLPMIASILYHLAETKHGLPGIWPFNLYTNYLLNLDRFFAIASGVIFSLQIITFPSILDSTRLMLLGLSIFSLMISERDIIYQNITGFKIIPILFKVGKVEFTIFHCSWHFLAYYGIYLALNLKNN